LLEDLLFARKLIVIFTRCIIAGITNNSLRSNTPILQSNSVGRKDCMTSKSAYLNNYSSAILSSFSLSAFMMSLQNPLSGLLITHGKVTEISVHDKKICHARAGGQPSIKIIRYPNQSTEDWFAR